MPESAKAAGQGPRQIGRCVWRAALGVVLLWTMAVPGAVAADRSREQAIRIVTQVQRADYEGDRAALKRLHAELEPFLANQEIAVRIAYWRGFALWRRAINGFNDATPPEELQQDLKQALDEFSQAAQRDRGFEDAKIGALSCAGLIGATLIQNNPARLQDADVKGWWARVRQLTTEAQAIDAENPRLLWAMGPNVWHIPVERGGGPAKAIEMYEKGLEVMRRHKPGANDPLEPSWGEPELLMSLAWSNLNRATPDPNAAERYARSALAIVPYWHYVRDILMPQIREAKVRQQAELVSSNRKLRSGRIELRE
jgi:hypothetical protein